MVITVRQYACQRSRATTNVSTPIYRHVNTVRKFACAAIMCGCQQPWSGRMATLGRLRRYSVPLRLTIYDRGWPSSRTTVAGIHTCLRRMRTFSPAWSFGSSRAPRSNTALCRRCRCSSCGRGSTTFGSRSAGRIGIFELSTLLISI